MRDSRQATAAKMARENAEKPQTVQGMNDHLPESVKAPSNVKIMSFGELLLRSSPLFLFLAAVVVLMYHAPKIGVATALGLVAVQIFSFFLYFRFWTRRKLP